MPKIKLNDLDYGGSPTVEDADHLMVADTRNQTLSAQNIITNILGDMAQLEHNATASKAYAKGEYLVLGSYFYKVTAAIAQGDTLVAGTNIEQTNVGAEMSELNSNLIDVKTLRGSAEYYKKNGIVRLNFNGDINGSVPDTTWTLLANLPQGYRPPTAVDAHLACGSYGKGNAILRVKSDGVVEAFQNNGGSENAFWGECIFFAGTQMVGN